MKPWMRGAYSILCGATIIAASPSGALELLLLEPNIGGVATGDVVHVADVSGVYYLDWADMIGALRAQYDAATLQGHVSGHSFRLDESMIGHTFNGRNFYSIDAYERLIPIKLNVDVSEMRLDITSDMVLPVEMESRNSVRRMSMPRAPAYDTFADYKFDNRYFTFPVIDFIYRYNHNFRHIDRDDYGHAHNSYYQANIGAIFAGLDTRATLFGDDAGNANLNEMRARISAGRTLLDEPGNALNLVRFAAGDITGVQGNMFYNASVGRGVMASSFKDLVVSADKTIDITGPMPAGWEAELYLNNQLIGFRQSSISGRYEFNNIPVNYGLNDFRVMLYGPYGEVREIPRRYYSGTSPVGAGQFGYNITAMQPNRYVIETNEPYVNPSDKIAADTTFYYGLSDYVTLISGFANAEDAINPRKTHQFGTLGAQLSLNGLSVQYNANLNLNRGAVGHHVDAQGDVYIGTLFGRYEYYGDMKSPISFYQNTYLRNLFEGRLTGNIPWINTPYYVAYTTREGHNGDKYHEVTARLSPSFMRYYNFTIENTWRRDVGQSENYIDAMFQATYGRMRANGRARYQTLPDNMMRDYGAFVEYRWDKNTFVSATWTHDCRSNYGNGADVDTLGIGIGRLFRFGGLNFNAAIDTERNLSLGLTYNISVGRVPDSVRLFANSENQMIDYGTIYAHATDNTGAPVPDVALIVNGREAPSLTDANGDAIITNLEPYQKSMIVVDEQNVSDLSLVPEWTEQKLVLRPGAVRPIDIVFNHLGAIEGQLISFAPNMVYMIYIQDANGEIVATRRADSNGGFVFNGIKYGDYTLCVVNSKGQVTGRMNIKIDRAFQTIKTPLSKM